MDLEIDPAVGEERKQGELDVNCCLQAAEHSQPREEKIDQIDYKAKINLFLEMERLRMLSVAVQRGMSEAVLEQLMQEVSLIDFDLDHLQEILHDREEAAQEQANAA